MEPFEPLSDQGWRRYICLSIRKSIISRKNITLRIYSADTKTKIVRIQHYLRKKNDDILQFVALPYNTFYSDFESIG